MVPASVTRAVMAEEMPGVEAFCQRRGWVLKVVEDDLRLVIDMQHPKDGSALRLHGDLLGYRALPPVWTYVDPETALCTMHASPSAGQLPGGGASIFINHGGKPVICAPFNRLAYKDADQKTDGPHQDWGGCLKWMEVRGQHVYAVKLGDMLQVIHLHLSYSPGRMG